MPNGRPRHIDMRKCLQDFPYYAANLLKIKDKNSILRPLVLWEPQQKLHTLLEDLRLRRELQRVIALKARQEGISTYSEARMFWTAHLQENTKNVVIAHEKESGTSIFGMCRLFYDCLPKQLRPMTRYSSKKELVFENPDPKTRYANPGLRSAVEVYTAGKKSVARGTTIHNLHCCFDPDVNVLTPSWHSVPISSLCVGDTLIGLDGNTTTITNIFEQEWEEPCVKITAWNNSSEPLTMTADHRLLTATGLKRASCITPNDYLAYPVGKITHKIKALNIDNMFIPVNRPQGGGYIPKPKVSYVDTTRSLGFFFGLFWAEGSYGAYSNATGLPSKISISIHEDEVPKVLLALSVLSKWFVAKPKPRKCKSSKTVNIELNDAILARFMYSLFGPDKTQIPAFFFDCGEKFVLGIVHGYLFGDGGLDKYCDRISVTSIRSNFIYWTREALIRLRLGYSGVLYAANRDRYGVVSKPVWILNISGQTFRNILLLCTTQDPIFVGRPHVEKWVWSEAGDYVYLKIKAIEDVQCFNVIDIEVTNSDHMYLTSVCASHNSELASWAFPDDVIPALLPTIPKNDSSLVIYESTAKGVGNFFHNEWLRAKEGESNFKPFFLAWFDLAEYSRAFSTDTQCAEFNEHLNDEEKELMREFSLSLEQLYWRRLTIADLKGDVELFRQEYPSTPEEAFLVSGVPIFDRSKLRMIALKCRDPIFRGDFTSRGLQANEQGPLKIWRQPEAGGIYALGADVADGGQGGDYSCVEVWKKLPAPYVAEQVAEWHGHLDPYNFAHVIAPLARAYNEALVAVETNAHGLATQQELQRHYWNLYQQEHFDRYKNQLQNKIGWETTQRTKKLLISFGTHCISDMTIIVHSSDFVRECMTFVRDATGSAEASSNGYDDRVMAGLIGLFVLHQSVTEEPEDNLAFQVQASPISLEQDAGRYMIDSEFAAILEFGRTGDYEQTWMNY